MRTVRWARGVTPPVGGLSIVAVFVFLLCSQCTSNFVLSPVHALSSLSRPSNTKRRRFTPAPSFGLPSWQNAFYKSLTKSFIAVDGLLDRITHQDDKDAWEFNNHNWAALKESELKRAVPLQLIEGALPDDFTGVFLRVGPNADNDAFSSTKPSCFADADGMVHSVRFFLDEKNGGSTVQALYSCDWIETPRRRIEKKFQAPIFLRTRQLKGLGGLVRAILSKPFRTKLQGLSTYEQGPANTALLDFDGRVFCLHDGSAPFEIRLRPDGSFQSVGYESFGLAKKSPFSEHPKIDRETGSLIFHSYDHPLWSEKASSFSLGIIQPSRRKVGDSSSSSSSSKSYSSSAAPAPAQAPAYQHTKLHFSSLGGESSFSHDLAVTENYAVIVDNSIRYTLESLMKGVLFEYDKSCPMRIGLVPLKKKKNAESLTISDADILWFECDTSMAVTHYLNAWKEDGKVILWAPTYDSFSTEHLFCDADDTTAPSSEGVKISELVMDLNDPQRRVQTRHIQNNNNSDDDDSVLPTTALEFCTIHPDFQGKFCNYAFAATMSRSKNRLDGFAKVRLGSKDLDVQTITFDHATVGEPTIVPKKGSKSSIERSDAVYLVSYQFDLQTKESFLVVYDGETFDERPLAKFRMPNRVPNGYHGHWMDEQSLHRHLHGL